ncbi:MAG: putative dehydrogenase [Saprospiraceae bacterium]|jgi:predicted dehydrogenase
MKKKYIPSNTRRDFIKSSSLAVGSFFIVPSCAVAKGHVRPSDKLNIAAIGAGGKGTSDIFNAWNNGANNVVALCDVDRNQCKKSLERFPDAKFYSDFRVMFDEMKDEIDAVTISTPDHVHGVAAMTAIQLGIHVYVQKPLTHNIYEARQLTEGARRYQVVSQMGNQGASHPAQMQLVKWYDDGMIGNVHTVHSWTNRPVWPQGIPVPMEKVPLPEHLTPADWDLFIGPAKPVDYHPLYHPFKWRGWWNFGTGALGDMGCHLIDTPFRVLGLGYPAEVECSVGQVFTKDWTPEYIPEGCPPSSSVQIKFGPTAKNKIPITFNWSDGGIRPFHPELIPADDFLGGPGSGNGVIMIGDKGIMTCGTYGRQPILYLNNGDKITMPEDFDSGNPYSSLPESGHQIAWTEACKAGFNSNEQNALTSSFDYSGPLTETVLMGNLAIRSYTLAQEVEGRRQFTGRKKLIWDGEAMKVTNFDEANQFVSRPYREGWKLI